MLILNIFLIIIQAVVYAINNFSGLEKIKETALPEYYLLKYDYIDPFIDKVANASVVTILAWSMFGALMYVLMHGLHGLMNGAGEVYKSTFKYVHPANHTAQRFYLYIIAERGFFLLMLAALVGYLQLFFKYIPSQVSEFYYEGIAGFVDSKTLLIVPVVLLSVVAMHMIVVLLRYMLGRYHHFE